MAQFIESVQVRIRQTSTSMGLVSLRLASGIFAGLCFALIGEQIMNYGSFAFWLVIVVSTSVFMTISRKWKAIGVVIFNLVFVLCGMLLRMYILIAPGQ